MSRALLLLLTSASLIALFGQSPDIPPYILGPPQMAWDDGQDPMRSRLFRTTTKRTQIDLGGWWDFVADPEDLGESRRYYSKFPAPETALWVPGTWNAVARYWNYVGPGWYKRRFDMPADGNLRICFGSVFYTARVWVDGRLAGEHEGGYLPFSLTLKDFAKGSHTLVVRADNRLTEYSLPKANTDWFPYGGIDRPVYAEIVAPVFVERFHVVPFATGGRDARVSVRLLVRNLGPAAADADVVFSVDGKQLRSVRHTLKPGTSAVELEAKLASPRLWSPSSPNLYSARVALDPSLDDQFTRFGIREIRADGPAIRLNGPRLKLAGANRHEDHPEWGSAAPPHLLRQDVEIIKRLGANAVRAHYPLPEIFMDYCDQHGLVFLSEVPAWQQSAAQLRTQEVQDRILSQFEQMVVRDMNHPSVIAWSLGNEWPKPDESYDVIAGLVQRARKFDPTRFLMFVTGGAHAWRVHGLIDVIGVNWAQYQWYDPFTTLDSAEGEKSIAELSRIHERYPNKPVILTEIGGAESQAGWHNWGNVKWSEEYQARNVEDSARHALDEDWISGGCVWQFSDTRSAPERFLAGRMRGWNGKGIVDAWRSPKLAFYRLQQLYREAAPEHATSSGGK